MFARFAVAALAVLIVTGCDRQSGGDNAPTEAPSLDNPAPDAEPSRIFVATNDAARTATGQVTESRSYRFPDQAGGEAQETLTLQGATGLIISGEINAAVSPATQVQGQTLRALLNIPVDEQQALVYRVVTETKPANGQGACGSDAAAFVVVWEPSGPGDAVMKVMGLSGGAPGSAGARACPTLEYRRS